MFSNSVSSRSRDVYYVRYKNGMFHVSRPSEDGIVQVGTYDTIYGRLSKISKREVLSKKTNSPVYLWTWLLHDDGEDGREEDLFLDLPLDSRIAEELIFRVGTWVDFQLSVHEGARYSPIDIRVISYTTHRDGKALYGYRVIVNGEPVISRYVTPDASGNVIDRDAYGGLPLVAIPSHKWISDGLGRNIRILSSERLDTLHEIVDRINRYLNNFSTNFTL